MIRELRKNTWSFPHKTFLLSLLVEQEKPLSVVGAGPHFPDPLDLQGISFGNDLPYKRMAIEKGKI